MAFVALVHGACEHGEGQEAERWFQARTTVPRRRMERRFDSLDLSIKKHGIIEHQKTWGIGPPNLFKRHALNHVDRYRRGRHMIKAQNLSAFINMNKYHVCMVLNQGPRLPIVGKGCMQYTWEIQRTILSEKKHIQQPQPLEHVYLFHSFLTYPCFLEKIIFPPLGPGSDWLQLDSDCEPLHSPGALLLALPLEMWLLVVRCHRGVPMPCSGHVKCDGQG